MGEILQLKEQKLVQSYLSVIKKGCWRHICPNMSAGAVIAYFGITVADKRKASSKQEGGQIHCWCFNFHLWFFSLCFWKPAETKT